MAGRNAAFGLVSMLMLAASIVLIIFVILSGLNEDVSPLNKTYFLRADTKGMTDAMSITQWTYFYICGDNNSNCGKPHPAPAFGSGAWSGNPDGVPSELVGSHGGNTTSTFYFYMWRFSWVFYLIALFFDVIALLSSFLACFGRLGSAISGLVAMGALFCYTVAAALMTATFVKARNAFRAEGHDAEIGKYAFGFTWGAWLAIFIAVVLFFLGVGKGRNDGVSSRRRWGRQRSTRSRRSYDVGSMSGRRVKDDYS